MDNCEPASCIQNSIHIQHTNGIVLGYQFTMKISPSHYTVMPHSKFACNGSWCTPMALLHSQPTGPYQFIFHTLNVTR